MSKNVQLGWLVTSGFLRTMFDIIEVGQDGQIHQRLVKFDKKDGFGKRYVTYKKLFEAIQEYREESGKHTGRLLTFKKLQFVKTVNVMFQCAPLLKFN